jgi:ubiquinone/menaquinone biosynthesis C-methylase UbiE
MQNKDLVPRTLRLFWKVMSKSGEKSNKFEHLLSKIGDMALKRRARIMLEELELRDDDKILDCGCGDGFYLHLISQISNCELYGLDVDPNALASARRNLGGRKVTLIEGNVTSLPFENDFFDKIILSEVLEHVQDDAQALHEVRRVLKLGGFVLITVPNRNYPFLWDPVNKAMELFMGRHIKNGFWSGIWHQHLRLYSLDDLRNLIKDVRFDLVKIEGLTHYCLPFNHYLVNIGARLLYGNRLPSGLVKSVSKFHSGENKNNPLTREVFRIIDIFDRLNDRNFLEKSTVSIFLKARKANEQK